MNSFSRSWEITKLSFEVMKKDKELFIFPILAVFFSALFLFALLFPTIILTLISSGGEATLGAVEVFILFIAYFGLAFISTFFNFCVVYTAKKRFEGGNATFGESIGFAFSKIHLIFLWSIVVASVGLILKLIEDAARKSKGAGKLVFQLLRGALGTAWNIVTIFVIPVMVYEGLGPFNSIKRSVSVLKKTWGESLIKYFGFGLIQFLLILAGLVIFVPLIFLSALLLGIIGALIFVILAIIYLVMIVLTFGIMNSIFDTALYVYATKGKVPEGYTRESLQGAFGQERNKVF
jgi:hypothetical protein